MYTISIPEYSGEPIITSLSAMCVSFFNRKILDSSIRIIFFFKNKAFRLALFHTVKSNHSRADKGEVIGKLDVLLGREKLT